MFGNIWKAHDSIPWQNNFINEIQTHNQSPWFKLMAIYLSKAQFSLAISKLSSRWQYLKPNFHWQHQSPILIGNIKVQFSLTIFKTQFSLAISKPNSYWQYQNPILIGNIKTQFSLAIFKAQFSLAISKPNSHWQYQKPNFCWHY